MNQAVFRPQYWLDYEEALSHFALVAGDPMAVRWASSVDAATRDVLRQPDLGRIRRDLQPEGIRSLLMRKPAQRYLLFYRWDSAEKTVEFIRIRHGATNLPAQLED